MIELIYPIPETLKVWFVDNWIFDGLRKLGYKTLVLKNLLTYHSWSQTVSKVKGISEIIEQDKLSAINEAINCIKGIKDIKNKITLVLDIATELNNYKKTADSITQIKEAIECTQQLITNEEKSFLYPLCLLYS